MSYAPLPTAAQTLFTRERIAAHDVEIAALEAQVVLVRSRIDTVRREKAVNEAYIAPIRRLPFDILAEIVVFCATATGTSPQVLRTLSSVCRKWRDATLASPRAWSRIVHRYPDPNTSVCPRPFLQTLHDVQEWFSRGASALKDISFIPASGYDPEGTPSREALWELLCVNAPRARSLVLHVTAGNPATLYKRLFAIPMPHLSVVDIDHISRAFDRYTEHTMDTVYRFLENLPSLHGLITWRLPLTLPGAVRERVTSLYVRDVDGRSIMHCLRTQGGFPALRGFRIVNDAWDPRFPLNDADFHVQSSLEILRIESLPVFAGIVFKHLHVPRLSRLTLSIVDNRHAVYPHDAQDLLQPLLSNSAPPLVDLYLRRLPIEDADLLKVLKNLPLLKCVVLLEAALTNATVEALALPASTSAAEWLCPRLEQLCVTTMRERNKARPPISRSAMESLATARRDKWTSCQTLGNASPIAYLAVIRLENAQLNDGEVRGTWEWDVLPEAQDFTYTDIPTYEKSYNGRAMCETAWSQIESLLL